MVATQELLLGQGLYSIPEAARIIGLSPARVRRWVSGYKSAVSKKPPVMEAGVPEMEGKIAVSFLDLLELRFIKAFLDKGVSLQKIRKATECVGRILKVESHPFTTHRFMTDRKSILHQAHRKLLNVNEGQYELEGIIKQSLLDGFVYDGTKAIAWHPEGKKNAVLLHPHYALGKPVIEHTAIRTRAIYHAWQAEKNNTPLIARLFCVTPKAVRQAVSFEQKIAA